MRERFLISAALFRRKLPSPFIKLPRHLDCLFARTSQTYQGARECFNFTHNRCVSHNIDETRAASFGETIQRGTRRRPSLDCYFTESAGTILMLSTPMRLLGRSGGWVGVVAIFSSTSSPLINLPKAVYCLSRNRGVPWQMKNWLPAESGSCERAMDRTPRS